MRSTAWSSSKSLHEDSRLGALLHWVRELTDAYRIEAWGNVVSRGEYIGEHDHAHATNQARLCGVYYPRDSATALVFADGQRVAVEAGLLVLFGPLDRHSVPEHEEDPARYSVAFNCY